ncbi:cysteine-rich receptor-like protein kinase 28 isoform X1 [Triticum aestivum]|uniref:cysteine-rich receptor-like protein kinase 28 isoform X1 n=1 Tax=Triticum aestivum TaxID=4565 RepID=UPI0008439E59|nr:cysteine-rich receptor-like protein kinase 28 isoform X1 [Triticum aestivum]
MVNKLEHSGATTREFTLELLRQITDNFSEKHEIGRGGFGIVYKGVLDDGEEIAIKKLHCVPGLDDTQFRNEFNNLMTAQHPNITRLIGYCYYLGHQRIKYNDEYVFAHVVEKCLCFEYLKSGSLDKHISDESCGLDWHTRFKIIKGVSEGLNYLHNGCKDSIYHLDLKPGNILLDKNMVPKIGDFGLSRLFQSEKTHITSKFVGTVGYMPPEYINRGAITTKFDIFSLGVIIVRIVAGHEGYSRCEQMSPQEFIEHVHENWRKRLQETMSSYTSEQVKTCIEIALRCVEFDREKRPTIADIVDELNKIEDAGSSAIGKISEETEHSPEKQLAIEEQKIECTKEHTRYARTNRISTLVKYHAAESIGFVIGAMVSLSLTPKLVELPSDKYNLHVNCKKEVEYLYKELVRMQAGRHDLAEVSRDQLDEVVKLWAEEVKDLLYQEENTVDLDEVPRDQLNDVVKLWAEEVKDLSYQEENTIDLDEVQRDQLNGVGKLWAKEVKDLSYQEENTVDLNEVPRDQLHGVVKLWAEEVKGLSYQEENTVDLAEVPQGQLDQGENTVDSFMVCSPRKSLSRL